MLLNRFTTYLSQKNVEVPQEHLHKIATAAGYSNAEIQLTLLKLAHHEYVLREEWTKGKSTFKWAKEQVDFNRKMYGV